MRVRGQLRAERFTVAANEELLGHDEYDGSGRPIRYGELEPFATMDEALRDGRIRVFCLGVTLDALTLAGDILTVAIISSDTYNQLFSDAVETNAEGSVPARAFPFEQNTLNWLSESKRLSPGTAAALHTSRGLIGSCCSTRPLRTTAAQVRHVSFVFHGWTTTRRPHVAAAAMSCSVMSAQSAGSPIRTRRECSVRARDNASN